MLQAAPGHAAQGFTLRRRPVQSHVHPPAFLTHTGNSLPAVHRLSGNIPAAYADNTVFTKLKTLRLGNNQLSGPLPAWTRRGAFKSLATLDLSNNLFSGALGRPVMDPWQARVRKRSPLGLLRSLCSSKLGAAFGRIAQQPQRRPSLLLRPGGLPASWLNTQKRIIQKVS